MIAFLAGVVAGVLLSALVVGAIGVRYRTTVRTHLDGLDRANRTAEYARADALRAVTGRAVADLHPDAPSYYLNSYRAAAGHSGPGAARPDSRLGSGRGPAAGGAPVRPAPPSVGAGGS